MSPTIERHEGQIINMESRMIDMEKQISVLTELVKHLATSAEVKDMKLVLQTTLQESQHQQNEAAEAAHDKIEREHSSMRNKIDQLSSEVHSVQVGLSTLQKVLGGIATIAGLIAPIVLFFASQNTA